MSVNKPIPETNSDHEEEFWQFVKQGEVCVQHCVDCRQNTHPPRMICPECYSENWEFQEIEGTGKVYGYTAIHRSSHPRYEDELPVVSVVVDLPEGPRMMGIVDCEIDDIEVGMTVKLTTANLEDDDVRFIFELI